MSDIEDLSSRILSAMDRVASGLEGLGKPDSDAAEALRHALDEERQVNADLTERVRLIEERQQKAVATMEAKARDAQDRMRALDAEVQQLRRAHDMLIEASEALRTANAEGVGEADLINAAVLAELEATRAIRRTEIAEAEEIIAGLMPLLSASQPAAQPTQETS